ncbi:unnamed protein product [Phaedon cochleariae]|uniref:Uncharacterized protein n=1 Tax=Phaedon cochleariae TaxID=80249 RepID=A0A9N9S7M2_PHACE|nr:unnamed protein product [Phaedon cochleariae]
MVTKFGRTFKNIHPISESEVAIGDWLVVAYDFELSKSSQGNGNHYFIGQITGIKERGYFEGKFVRPKTTKNYCDYIYNFPDVPDVDTFHFEKVVGKVSPPENYLRGLLKFALNSKDLEH